MGNKDSSKKTKNISVDNVDPLYDITELRSIASADQRQPFDIRSVIARIVDGSEFTEFKKLYGTVSICCF